MLRLLRIEQLILIEKATICFGEGLNILTGETGSGKSAILAAIRLLLGQKASEQLIRKDAERAVVEAEVSPSPALAALAFNEGLDPPGQSAPCLIRRELLRSGKSRCFFNDQQIGLGVLKKLLASSIELVEQDSAFELSSPEEQRGWIDLWAGADLKSYAAQYHKTRALSERLAKLLHEQQVAQLAEERLIADLAEIEEALALGDEDALSAEHHRLSAAAQLAEKLDSTLAIGSIASELTRLSLTLQAASEQAACHLKSASLEVLEAERIVQKALDQLEIDPRRLEMVERQIGLIEKLKRKHPTDLKQTALLLKEKLSTLDRLSLEIETIEKEEREAQELLSHLTAALTQQRRSSAQTLQELIREELGSLNLPHARVEIQVLPKERSEAGADEIRILFTANPGEKLLALQECASGGERARFLFAIKILFAEKEKRSCLIFDEIDSNIGGKTASLLGEKLHLLSTYRQVICVTHFVQVARSAAHHFLVSKISEAAGTRTLVEKLDSAARLAEYARMVGNAP